MSGRQQIAGQIVVIPNYLGFLVAKIKLITVGQITWWWPSVARDRWCLCHVIAVKCKCKCCIGRGQVKRRNRGCVGRIRSSVVLDGKCHKLMAKCRIGPMALDHWMVKVSHLGQVSRQIRYDRRCDLVAKRCARWCRCHIGRRQVPHWMMVQAPCGPSGSSAVLDGASAAVVTVKCHIGRHKGHAAAVQRRARVCKRHARAAK